MYQCQNCIVRPKFAAMSMLEEHVAVHHFKFTPYQCQECLELFGTEFAIVNHYRNVHGLEEFNYAFHYVPGCFEIRESIKFQSQMGEIETLPRAACTSIPVPTASTSSQELIKMEHNYTEKELVIAMSTPPTSQETSNEEFEEENLVENVPLVAPSANSKLKSTAPQILVSALTPKIGNINFSEFEEDSILRNDETLAEVMKRSQDLNKIDEKKVTCRQCGVLVSDQRSSRFYHANTKHIKLPLYECLGCEKKWCTISRSDVVKHVQAMHRGDESLIVDHKARVRQQLRVLVELCFPKNNTKKDGTSSSNLNLEENEDEENEEEELKKEVEEKLEDGQVDDDEPTPKKKRQRSMPMSIFKNC